MTLTRLGKCLPEPILFVSIKDELQLRAHLEKELWRKTTKWALVVYRNFSMRFTLIQVHKVLYSYIHPPFKLTAPKSLELLTRQAKLPQHFVIQYS